MLGHMWKIAVVFLIFAGLVESLNDSQFEEETYNCVNGSSDSDFPEDLFTEDQRKQGAIVLHFLMSVMCFTTIALVCDNYFLPSVECICSDLNLSHDVAGATFMAIATSTPELFLNIIGTFITESDLGVGTIVGSAMFNALGVVSCIGLAAREVIYLQWWPLTRDCSIYIIACGVLTAITYDEKIFWYEAMILVMMYVLYFCIMYANGFLMKLAKKIVAKFVGITTELNEPEEARNEVYSDLGPGTYRWYLHGDFSNINKIQTQDIEKGPKIEKVPKTEKEPIEAKDTDPVGCPSPMDVLKMVWSVFKWPISTLLSITILDCKKEHLRKYYPATFLLCIMWIGISSYMNAWMMTTIGKTLGAPDSVMGLTFLAMGSCLPESFSSIIMARKGSAIGISNSVGANTLNILLCMGLPWFIKSLVNLGKTGNTSEAYVQIISRGVTYNCCALILCIVILYSVVSLFHFQLRKRVGFTCISIYLIFISLAVSSEMNLFFHVNDSLC